MYAAPEVVAVVGNIDPDAYAAGAYSTGWIKADKFLRYMAILQAGTLVATATLDFKLEQATTSGGAGVKDVTGRAITQLTEAGTDSDKQAVIGLVPADHLDIANGFVYFRATATLGTAGGDVGAVVLGVGGVNGPAKDHDVSTVDEVV